MKKENMLAKAVKLFASVRDKVTGGQKLGNVDSAVLRVAMMIAALDGDVSEAELATFEKLAAQCRGFNKESAAKVFDEGLHAAGYLMLQAKRLNQKKLVELFADEAIAMMPDDFVLGSGADIRRAFVMWTTMAMSDRDYSDVERKAIAEFRRRLDQIVDSLNNFNENRRAAYAPSFSQAFVICEGDFRFKSATTDAFLANVEKLVAKLGRESTSDAALKELKELIVKG